MNVIICGAHHSLVFETLQSLFIGGLITHCDIQIEPLYACVFLFLL